MASTHRTSKKRRHQRLSGERNFSFFITQISLPRFFECCTRLQFRKKKLIFKKKKKLYYYYIITWLRQRQNCWLVFVLFCFVFYYPITFPFVRIFIKKIVLVFSTKTCVFCFFCVCIDLGLFGRNERSVG